MSETPDRRLVWAGQLADQVAKQIDGRHLAAHLFARLAALLHTQEIQFVQVTAEINRHFHESGDLRVWTDRHLAIVRFDMLACSPPGMRPSTLEDHTGSSVNLKLVPRTALHEIAVPDTTSDGAFINGGMAWSAGINEGDWSWPRWGTLLLTYNGVDQPITLPGKGDLGAFERMIPSLLEDLVTS